VDRILDPVVLRLRRLLWRLWPKRRAAGGANAPAGRVPSTTNPPVVTGLRRQYYAMIQVPDSHVGWLGSAM
jgi:hypothetical protein